MKKYLYITLRIITAFVVVLLRVTLVPLRAIASGAKYVRAVDECQQHYRPPRIPLDD